MIKARLAQGEMFWLVQTCVCSRLSEEKQEEQPQGKVEDCTVCVPEREKHSSDHINV